MGGFSGLTILVLATNEQYLLRETLNTAITACGADDICEIVVVLQSEHCPAASVCRGYGDSYGGVRLRTYIQQNRDKILFFAEVPFLAKSSHFVIMAADMEMDPDSLRAMLKTAKEKPESIVCAAKWLKESDVFGYGCMHRIANVAINRTAALITGNHYKDLFSIYQIYPKSVFDRMRFDNMRTLLFEYTLKPVTMGVSYIELSTVYRKRTEGKANTGLILFFRLGVRFLFTAIRLRFSEKKTSV